MIREIRRGIRNLIYWAPIIWQDRNFDYVYLYRILRHKIKAMSDSIPDWYRVDNEEVQESMDLCVKILDDLLNDVHEQKAFDAHEEIFGKAKWEFSPSKEHPGYSELNITYPDAEDQEVADRALISFGQIAEMTNQLNKKLLFETISRYIDRWWD